MASTGKKFGIIALIIAAVVGMMFGKSAIDSVKGMMGKKTTDTPAQ